MRLLKNRGISTTEAMITSVLFLLIMAGGLGALLRVTNQQTHENNTVEASAGLESARAMLIHEAGTFDSGTMKFDLNSFTGNYEFCYEPGSDENFTFEKDMLPTNCENRHFVITMNVQDIQVPENIRSVSGSIKWHQGGQILERNIDFNMSKPRASNDGHRLKITVFDGRQEFLSPGADIGVSGIQVITYDKNNQLLIAYTNNEGVAYIYGMKQDINTPVVLVGNRRLSPHYYFRGGFIDPLNDTIWDGADAHAWTITFPASTQGELIFNDTVPHGQTDPIGKIFMWPFGEIRGRVTYALDAGTGLSDPDAGDPFPGVEIEVFSNRSETGNAVKFLTRTDNNGYFHEYVPPGFYTLSVVGTTEINTGSDRHIRPIIQTPDLRDDDTGDAFDWPIIDYSAIRGPDVAQGFKHEVENNNPVVGNVCDDCIRVLPGRLYDSSLDTSHPVGTIHDHDDEEFNGSDYISTSRPAFDHRADNNRNGPLETHFEVYRKAHVTGSIFLAQLNVGSKEYERQLAGALDNQGITLQYEEVNNVSDRASYPLDVTVGIPAVPPPPAGTPNYNASQWQLKFPFDGIGNNYYRINNKHRVGTVTDNGDFRFPNVGHSLIDINYRSGALPTTMFDQRQRFSLVPNGIAGNGSPVWILTEPNPAGPTARQIYVLWLDELGRKYANHGDVTYWKDYVALPSPLVFDRYHHDNNHTITASGWTGLENWGRDNPVNSSPFIGDLYSYPIIRDLFHIGQDDMDIDILVLPETEFATVQGSLITPNNTPWFYPVNNSQEGLVRTVALDRSNDHMRLGTWVETTPNVGVNHTFTFQNDKGVLPSLPNYDRNVFTAAGVADTFPPQASFNWDPAVNPVADDGSGDPYIQQVRRALPWAIHPVLDPMTVDYLNANPNPGWNAMGYGNERYFFFTLKDRANLSDPHTQMIKMKVSTKLPGASGGPLYPAGVEYLNKATLVPLSLEFEGALSDGSNIGWSAGFNEANSEDLMNAGVWTDVVTARLLGDQNVPLERQYKGVSAPAFVPSTSLRNEEQRAGRMPSYPTVGTNQQINIVVDPSFRDTKLPIYMRASAATRDNFFDTTFIKNGLGTYSSHCPDPINGCSVDFNPLRNPQNPNGYYETHGEIRLVEKETIHAFAFAAHQPSGPLITDFKVDLFVKDRWNGSSWVYRRIRQDLVPNTARGAEPPWMILVEQNGSKFPLLSGDNFLIRFKSIPATDTTPAYRSKDYRSQGSRGIAAHFTGGGHTSNYQWIHHYYEEVTAPSRTGGGPEF